MPADPTPPNLNDPPVPPQRSDSTNFAARADAFLSWVATALITDLRAALEWIRNAVDDALAASSQAASSASTAVTKASVAASSAATAVTKASEASASAASSASNAVATISKATEASASASSALSSANIATAKAVEAAASAANAGYANVTSTTAQQLTLGSKVFTVNAVRAYVPSLPVRIVYSAGVYMQGTITAVSGLNITVNVTEVFGVMSTYAQWTFAVLEGINAPTKTGAGASGVWSIDISGNANSASSAKAGSALRSELDARAPLASPSFSGTPTVPTAAVGTANAQIANTQFVATAVANLVNSAPAALDTLGELAAALGNNQSLASSALAAIATKVGKTSDIRPGVTQLYRRDADSNHTLEMYWTGLRWRLGGYNGDGSFHAHAEVGCADSISGTGTSSIPTSALGNNTPGAGVFLAGDRNFKQVPSLGIGQYWYDVKSLRSYNTYFTNTTNLPILVSISAFTDSTGGVAQIVVNGIVVASAFLGATAGIRSYDSFSAVVPPGAQYKVIKTDGVTVLIWAELRA